MNALRAWLDRRRRDAEQQLLHALDDGEWHFAVVDLATTTRLPIGWLYLALARLEGAGLVESTWRGGPELQNRRRGYRLSWHGLDHLYGDRAAS